MCHVFHDPAHRTAHASPPVHANMHCEATKQSTTPAALNAYEQNSPDPPCNSPRIQAHHSPHWPPSPGKHTPWRRSHPSINQSAARASSPPLAHAPPPVSFFFFLSLSLSLQRHIWGSRSDSRLFTAVRDPICWFGGWPPRNAWRNMCRPVMCVSGLRATAAAAAVALAVVVVVAMAMAMYGALTVAVGTA